MRRLLEGAEFWWVVVGLRVRDEVVLRLGCVKLVDKLKVTCGLAGLCPWFVIAAAA